MNYGYQRYSFILKEYIIPPKLTCNLDENRHFVIIFFDAIFLARHLKSINRNQQIYE